MISRSSVPLCLALTACGAQLTEPPDASVADAGPRDVAVSASPWVDFIDVQGEPSSVRSADLDDDGYLDLVASVVLEAEAAERLELPAGAVALWIAWGHPDTPWLERSVHPWSSLRPDRCRGLRDTSSDVLQIADLDGDGAEEVLSAAGFVRVSEARDLARTAWPGPTESALSPVAVVERDGEIQVLRGRRDGRVDACGLGRGCEELGGQREVRCPAGVDCRVLELSVVDVDQDGREDVVAGITPVEAPFTGTLRLWLADGREATTWAGPHAVDHEWGDLDGDGYPDLVAQRRETYVDFPSETEVWLSDPGRRRACARRAGPLCLAATLENHDNHNDNAALADFDRDGCLDLLRIGVDTSRLSLARGRCDGSFADPELLVSPANVIGVQLVDLTGDERAEVVLRTYRQLSLHEPGQLLSGCDRARHPLIPSTVEGDLVRLHARGRLDSADEPVPFLFDTGSSASFVTLAPDPTQPPIVTEAASAELACRWRPIYGRRDVQPNEDLRGRPVVGTIGADVLLFGDAAVLDLEEHRFGRISPATFDSSAWQATSLPFDDVLGHIIVTVEVDGETLRLMLDTGSPYLLWLGQSRRAGDVEVTTQDATGNALSMFLGPSELRLGDEPAQTVTVLRAPSFPYFEETVRLLGGDIDGLLGLGGLEGRVITVDGSRERMHLSRPHAPLCPE